MIERWSKRKNDNKNLHIQYIFTLFCYHIGPVFKVSNLNDKSINSSCVVGPPHVIILVSIPEPIAWNLLKHFIEFPNIIIIQSHLPHVREGFSLFWLTFRGRIPVCPPKKRFLTPSGVSLHFSEPRPFCITKPNNDFFYVGQTSLMRSRLVSGPAIHIAALSRRAYSVERFFICTCLFMSCYWSKPRVDNWSSSYVHSIHVWL